MSFILALLLILQGQNTVGFRIAGQVVSASGNPVLGARVSIYVPGHADKQLSVVNGDNGEFAFTDLAPGKYSLQVNNHGRAEGYLEYQEYSTAIAVGPGLDTEHIRFEIHPGAQISGSVLDEAGDAVRNGSVYLFARWMYRGSPMTGLRQTKTTGNDGSFHFTHLEPGTYYVAVAGRPWYSRPQVQVQQFAGRGNAITTVPNPELDVCYPLTYYSGAISAEAATPIEVEPGSNVEIHFTLQPAAAVHVTLDGLVNTAERRVNASWRVAGPGGTIFDVPPTWGNETGVAICPGTYRISTDEWVNNQMAAYGSQDVTLTSDTTVRLADAVKTSVTGKILFEGQFPPGIAVLLEGVNNTNQAPAFVEKDGSFDMRDVAPGRYNLRLANTEELYMKSIAVKGSGKFSNGALELNRGAKVELTIQVARGVGQIDGVALREGQAMAGAMVLAIPQDFSHGNYIPRDQSDSDGTFSLRYAWPGKYLVVAIDDGRELAYADGAVMQPYRAKAVEVTVPSAEASRVQVEVQRRR